MIYVRADVEYLAMAMYDLDREATMGVWCSMAASRPVMLSPYV
jgi:hypothetical protein